MLGNRAKVLFLFLGDIAALYVALFATLFFRYGGSFYAEFLENHFLPFTIIFALWVVVFYIAGLYDLRHLRNNLDFLKILGVALLINFVLAVFFFYLVPAFGITPKTNLFVFLLVFAFIEFFWRRRTNKTMSSGEAPNKIILIGDGGILKPIEEIELLAPDWLKQLGYDVVGRIEEGEALAHPSKISALRKAGGANLIVIPRHLKSNAPFARELYKLLSAGAEIYDLPRFYEIITRKIPLAALEETWFLENLSERQRFYDPLKRAAEFLAALAATIILIPLGIIIAAAIKLTSRGPIIYKQTRVGLGGRGFTFYKFRTMKMHDDHSWPEENDSRITAIGRILRKIHFDEWPQLWNIIRGDISIVGPRPDFIDFYKKLEKEIPYYTIRTLVRPGLTGWAQIHKPITASLEETKERLEYDLYYIKNRSLILDLAIILKTFKVLLTAKGR